MPQTSLRKTPRQARSAQLVADILEAAVRVLEREGAARFTTIRVAEAAGVSVGSLYQYFPNKAAILFRLQVDEWEKTRAVIDAILGDERKPPARRLRAMVRAFFHSECAEAPLRNALDAATPGYHEVEEGRAGRERSRGVVDAFLRVAAPQATARERAFDGRLLFLTVTAVGKQLSERRPGKAEIERTADAIAAMLGGYLTAPRSRAARASTASRRRAARR